jgi:hypothetical protein
MDILIITYATDIKDDLRNWISSMELFGYKELSIGYHFSYKIIGLESKWINFRERMKAYRDYILDLKIDIKLIACVDGYDLLACGPCEELLGKFNNYYRKDRVIVGTEIGCCYDLCHSCDNWWKLNQERYNKYKYVNGGFIMGKPNLLVDIFTDIIRYSYLVNKSDDQWGIGRYTNDNPDKIELDTDSIFIANIHSINVDFTIRNGRIVNKRSNQNPLFFHTFGIINDFGIRYNRFGNYILKDKFIKHDASKDSNYTKNITIIVIIIIALIIIIAIYPKIFLLAIIILLLIIAFLCGLLDPIT